MFPPITGNPSVDYIIWTDSLGEEDSLSKQPETTEQVVQTTVTVEHTDNYVRSDIDGITMMLVMLGLAVLFLMYLVFDVWRTTLDPQPPHANSYEEHLKRMQRIRNENSRSKFK